MDDYNLELYDRIRDVPENATKPIAAGRLKGKTDINPMWRIKTLTEQFGPCGFGWRYEIIKMWNEQGANGEIASFVHINLFVKYKGEWSEGIQGIGGASFVSNEKNGAYTSDECYKMALTDAISVSCKALGMAADVYWDNDSTKYTKSSPIDDNRKSLNASNLGSEALMEWIYKSEVFAKKNKQRFSIMNLVEKNYKCTNEDINIISENYYQYKVNKNLQ
ncbi:hypothetical protein SAMN02910431_04602 [Bacteroides sp. AR20]|jgi:hypothetical protein|uniref:hypothetical protein n=1 Tax=Bacteroides sp. AR20 TaxID=93974 RepID=UPI0008CF69A5|nr:hypothetical protein [Bacteroides sp. AR20]SEO61296.1 hypothetical protein SAMN02910431_04602 [Bacteroides sp. AR20]DAS90324.1 MAG TPA: DNA repair protein [Caudoviricetes sp.]